MQTNTNAKAARFVALISSTEKNPPSRRLLVGDKCAIQSFIQAVIGSAKASGRKTQSADRCVGWRCVARASEYHDHDSVKLAHLIIFVLSLNFPLRPPTKTAPLNDSIPGSSLDDCEFLSRPPMTLTSVRSRYRAARNVNSIPRALDLYDTQLAYRSRKTPNSKRSVVCGTDESLCQSARAQLFLRLARPLSDSGRERPSLPCVRP
jgi:hypothetical protein